MKLLRLFQALLFLLPAATSAHLVGVPYADAVTAVLWQCLAVVSLACLRRLPQ